MEKESVTKEHFDETFRAFDERFERFSSLMMDSFSHFNLKFETKIDDLEKRLGRRIDELDNKIDSVEIRLNKRMDGLESRFDKLEIRMDYRFDAVEYVLRDKVSWPEYRALEGRVVTLEKVAENA